MKFKKICLSTLLSDLYGRDNYQSHIELNREYWYYFSRDSEIIEGWHKIRITYIRSGCAFYVFSDLPNIPERYFPVSCFMTSRLVFAEFDPIKDLPNFGSDKDKDYAKSIAQFVYLNKTKVPAPTIQMALRVKRLKERNELWNNIYQNPL